MNHRVHAEWNRPLPRVRLNSPKPVALPRVADDHCTGCGRCVAVCPPHVLSLRPGTGGKVAVLDDADHCTGCALCWVACPFDAITMVRRSDWPADPDPH